MATPSLSATFNFVKKYPITLCGFSLLFMPSLHRLVLYFTPLLLSTAIFVVAMMTWGPSSSSEKKRSSRKVKRIRLVGEHHEWAFHESMEDDDDDEEEEEEEEEDGEGEGEGEEQEVEKKEGVDAQASVSGEVTMALQKEEVAQKGEVGLARGSEPDPDAGLGDVGTPTTQAEPDPDLKGAYVGTASGSANDTFTRTHDDESTHVHDGLTRADDDASTAHNRSRGGHVDNNDDGDVEDGESSLNRDDGHVEDGGSRLGDEMGDDVHDDDGHGTRGSRASHATDHAHHDDAVHPDHDDTSHTHDHGCPHEEPHAHAPQPAQEDVDVAAKQSSYAIDSRLVQVSA